MQPRPQTITICDRACGFRQAFRTQSGAPSRKLSQAARCAREVKPAYNKYRSQKDIEQDYIKLWKEVTVRNTASLEPVTFWSSVRFVPAWIRFEALPMPLRFLWNYVWVQIVARWLQYHRHLTLQGAKLDAYLLARKGDLQPTFDRRRVLQRWHNSINRLDDFKYRLTLLWHPQSLAQAQQQ